eukprot:gene1463-1844_t
MKYILISSLIVLLLSTQIINGIYLDEKTNHLVRESKKIINNVKKEVNHENAGGIFSCSICAFIVSRIDQMILNNQTETQILQALEKDCNYFGKYAITCKTLISYYGPIIIEDIVNQENPRSVCSTIGLCTNTASSSPSISTPVIKPKESSDNKPQQHASDDKPHVDIAEKKHNVHIQLNQ